MGDRKQDRFELMLKGWEAERSGKVSYRDGLMAGASQSSGKEHGARKETWLASAGSLTLKATFEPEVSV